MKSAPIGKAALPEPATRPQTLGASGADTRREQGGGGVMDEQSRFVAKGSAHVKLAGPIEPLDVTFV